MEFYKFLEEIQTDSLLFNYNCLPFILFYRDGITRLFLVFIWKKRIYIYIHFWLLLLFSLIWNGTSKVFKKRTLQTNARTKNKSTRDKNWLANEEEKNVRFYVKGIQWFYLPWPFFLSWISNKTDFYIVFIRLSE